MEFINDDCAQVPEDLWRIRVGKQQSQALWRCEQYVRRGRALALLLCLWRVPGSRFHSHWQCEFLNRFCQIAMNIDSERLQRRNIERVQSLMGRISKLDQAG